MAARQCYLTVEVKDTDYDEDGEHIISTTANGVEVHGKCSPADGAPIDGRGFFECAKFVELPPSPDSTYTFVTTATDTVDENAYEGSYVFVEYMVDCEGTCQPPSAPPSAVGESSRPVARATAAAAGVLAASVGLAAGWATVRYDSSRSRS